MQRQHQFGAILVATITVGFLLVTAAGLAHGFVVAATSDINTHNHTNGTCLNHTDVVLESIRTHRTINATAAVIRANQTCDPGYTWSPAGECRKSIVTAARCADGYAWLAGRCERVQSAVCPAGYHKSNETGNCVLRVEFRVDCPQQHEWEDNQCVHRVPSCKPPYQLVNGSCVNLVPGNCPVGTELENNVCVRTQTTVVQCFDGFELIGGECRKRGLVFCQPDFELIDGQCVRQQTARPVYECPANMRLDGVMCVSRVQTCPVGYVLNGTQCVNETISCPAGAHLNADGRCVRSECLPVQPRCDDGFVLENGVCFLVRPVEPQQPQCTSDEIQVNGSCIRRCRTLEPQCPAGTYLEENVCLLVNGGRDERRPPVCQDGFVLNQNWCVHVHPQCVIILPECVPGFELHADGQCVRKVIVVPVVCPPGFVAQGAQCIRHSVTCPSGSAWQNGRCVPLQYDCIAGFVLINGRCTPIGGVVVLPCPPGTVNVSGVCTATATVVVVRPDGTCPAGHHLNGTVCTPDYLPPTCRPGDVLVNGWCVPDRRSPTSLPTPSICLDGYELRNGTCYQVGVPPYCPPGYRIHNALCYCPDSYPWANATQQRNDTQPPSATPQPPTVVVPVSCPPERPIRLANGTCAPANTTSSVCPPGYVFDARDALCHLSSGSSSSGGPGGSPGDGGNCTTNITPSLRPNATCPHSNVIIECTTGQYYNATLGNCVPKPRVCPPGFYQKSVGVCAPIRFECPPGFYFTNGACYPRESAENASKSNCTSCSHNDNCCGNSGSGNENIVHTVTIVDRPVNVVTNNENNVNVHVYENGRKVRIHRNNETTEIEAPTDIDADDNDANGHDDDADGHDGGIIVDEDNNTPLDNDDAQQAETPTANCCVVVSPRKCVQTGDQWDCTHRETQRCGSFCTRPKIYLIPRRTEYRRPVLVMRPPPPSWTVSWRQPASAGTFGTLHGLDV